MAEKLRKQAEESNQGYAMMPVEMTDQFFLLFATYKNGEDEIGVDITNLSGKSDLQCILTKRLNLSRRRFK